MKCDELKVRTTYVDWKGGNICYYDPDEVDAAIAELKEERRWRKFPEEKPSEELEGEDFLVSNGYYSVVCEWRGYWNNEPFCGDKNCDVVKFWMPLPPREEK